MRRRRGRVTWCGGGAEQDGRRTRPNHAEGDRMAEETEAVEESAVMNGGKF